MGEQVIEARARSGASPAEGFAVLADVSCWTRWGIWHRAELERPADEGPPGSGGAVGGGAGGTGAIRVLTSRAFGRTIVSRELVTEAVPGELVGYELLSGLPLRNYRARVELAPDGTGTAIRWVSRFDRAPLGTTWLYRAFFARFLVDTAQRLARYAEQRAGQVPTS